MEEKTEKIEEAEAKKGRVEGVFTLCVTYPFGNRYASSYYDWESTLGVVEEILTDTEDDKDGEAYTGYDFSDEIESAKAHFQEAFDNKEDDAVFYYGNGGSIYICLPF